MRSKSTTLSRLWIVLIAIVYPSFSAETKTTGGESSKYLNAVRTFADNVLKYGRDTYGPKHTPLFVDGINIHTHEPVTWIAPDGERWILSNLASQQNLFRTLDALSTITGDPKYRQAAMEAIEYAFEHLRSPNGLLYWGIGTAYDLRQEEVFGWQLGRNYVHCLKANFPYYELMWLVDPEATKQFIEAFWSEHILDWSSLDMNRWAHYSDIDKSLEGVWDRAYKGGPVFLNASGGGSFINTGTDMIFAATALTKLSGRGDSLVWAKRLAHKYVRTRHPVTGISYWMYTRPSWVVHDSYDAVMRKLVPGTTEFLPTDFPDYQDTNPKAREATCGQCMPTPGITVHAPVSYWQAHLLIGDMLAEECNRFKQWAVEELTAFGKASYRKKDNVYVPMLTDGTDLEGYCVKEAGPLLGPKGVFLQSVSAGASDFWAYAMACRMTDSDFMWGMSRSIAQGNNFGDIGAAFEAKPELNLQTRCADPYALLGFLELYKKKHHQEFLNMADKIGSNILVSRYHEHFFTPSDKHIYAKFDSIDSLALLTLHSVLVENAAGMPQSWPSLPYFNCPYRSKELGVDNDIFCTLTNSTEPRLSLHEAAAQGKIDRLRALLAQGQDLDSFEDSRYKTVLHRAVISGHRNIVELLLSKEVDVDAGRYDMGTPLYFAVQKERTQIAELLITHDADVNATNSAGDTPLHSAAREGHADIAGLLIANGAKIDIKNNKGQTPLDIALSNGHIQIVKLLRSHGAVVDMSSLHIAVQLGDCAAVRALLEDGADINAHDDNGRTALHVAVLNGDKDTAALLLEAGASPNVRGASGYTPLYYAVWKNDTKTTALLLANGADPALSAEGDYPVLHYAVWNDNRELVRMLVDNNAGFDVPDADGWTAFRHAVSQGSQDIVELFIEKGIDTSGIHRAACAGDLASVKRHLDKGVETDIRDEMGWTPLYWASSAGQKKTAEYLIANGASVATQANDNSTALHQAAKAGSTETVRLLLAEGADINAVDKQGCTPLYNAASSGNSRLVELLLAKEAAVNVQNRNGWTALHRAAFSGHKDIVETLMAAGANTAIRGKRGNTALDLARLRNNKEIVELLSNYSDAANKPSVSPAAINKKTYYYRMPLHQAAEEADLRELEYLIDNQADVNAESTHGWTALHRAAVAGNAEAAEFLLSRAAEPDTRNRWGWSPLHSACLYGHRSIVELLIANGADIEAKTPEEETPLRVATQRGYEEIAALLKKSQTKTQESEENGGG
jgi:pectate lyase